MGNKGSQQPQVWAEHPRRTKVKLGKKLWSQVSYHIKQCKFIQWICGEQGENLSTSMEKESHEKLHLPVESKQHCMATEEGRENSEGCLVRTGRISKCPAFWMTIKTTTKSGCCMSLHKCSKTLTRELLQTGRTALIKLRSIKCCESSTMLAPGWERLCPDVTDGTTTPVPVQTLPPKVCVSCRAKSSKQYFCTW